MSRDPDLTRPNTIHPENAPISTEELAREENAISPEGRPGNPRMGFRTVLPITIGVVFLALAVVAVVGYYFSPWLAIAMLVVGGLCAMIFNPVVWASAFRADDNERAARRATYKNARTRTTPPARTPEVTPRTPR